MTAGPSLIARGNGRAYGDAALNPDATLLTRRFDRILSFDEAAGILVCEGGTLLSAILGALPPGWFPPVVPGTKHVTVGGMVAADVHGKNHPHAGSFARHVVWLDVMIGDGTVLRCSPAENADLFEATLGGMGLTGVVLRAAFTLQRIGSRHILETTIRCDDLGATIAAFETHADATYAVAWIDLLSRGGRGRSLFQLGEHAGAGEPGTSGIPATRSPLRIPTGVPSFLINRFSMSAFNKLRFATARTGRRTVPLDRFFFPLDGLENWNRIYGRRGLVQYQFVLPAGTARDGLGEILAMLKGRAPILAVMKRFGTGRGMMSFPMPGYTLALDFPASPETLALLADLDRAVVERGGRIFLAKDAISTPDRIARSYSGLAAFKAVRDRVDPAARFSSLLSRRLDL